MNGFVFVSYSRRDSEYVERLVTHLSTCGLTVWVDQELDYGDRWASVIREQVDRCAVLVPVMSPAAEASQWVARELTRAELRGKPIIPLLLDGDPFFGLGDLQYEDVRGGRLPTTDAINRLRSLCQPPATASSAPPSAPVSAPTRPWSHTPGPWHRMVGSRRLLVAGGAAAAIVATLGVVLALASSPTASAPRTSPPASTPDPWAQGIATAQPTPPPHQTTPPVTSIGPTTPSSRDTTPGSVKLAVDIPTTVSTGQPFHVKVGVDNDTSRPISNPHLYLYVALTPNLAGGRCDPPLLLGDVVASADEPLALWQTAGDGATDNCEIGVTNSPDRHDDLAAGASLTWDVVVTAQLPNGTSLLSVGAIITDPQHFDAAYARTSGQIPVAT